ESDRPHHLTTLARGDGKDVIVGLVVVSIDPLVSGPLGVWMRDEKFVQRDLTLRRKPLHRGSILNGEWTQYEALGGEGRAWHGWWFWVVGCRFKVAGLLSCIVAGLPRCWLEPHLATEKPSAK